MRFDWFSCLCTSCLCARFVPSLFSILSRWPQVGCKDVVNFLFAETARLHIKSFGDLIGKLSRQESVSCLRMTTNHPLRHHPHAHVYVVMVSFRQHLYPHLRGGVLAELARDHWPQRHASSGHPPCIKPHLHPRRPLRLIRWPIFAPHTKPLRW